MLRMKNTRISSQICFRPSFAAKLAQHEILSGVGFWIKYRKSNNAVNVSKVNEHCKQKISLEFLILITITYYSWKWLSALKKDPNFGTDLVFKVDAHHINAISIKNFTLSLPCDYPAFSARYSSCFGSSVNNCLMFISFRIR